MRHVRTPVAIERAESQAHHNSQFNLTHLQYLSCISSPLVALSTIIPSHIHRTAGLAFTTHRKPSRLRPQQRPTALCLLSPPTFDSLRIMSRRVTPGQAAQNQQTIKNLLKLEPNKICADCKRNKRQSPPPTAHRGLAPPGMGLARLTLPLFRSALGVMEPGYLRLHSVLGHSPWNGHTH